MGFEDYVSAAAETPSDTGDVGLARGFYVGGTGDVSVVTKNGNTVVFTAVQVGTIIPIHLRRINSTGTTATSLLVLY